MRLISVLFLLVFMSGCATTWDTGDGKTTVVFGFAILKEKSDPQKKVLVTDNMAAGLIFDQENGKFGVGCVSYLCSKVFCLDDNVLLDIRRDFLGKLDIKVSGAEKTKGEQDEEGIRSGGAGDDAGGNGGM